MLALNYIESKIREAVSTLAAPPAYPWIERPKFIGQPVKQFILTLDLCKTGNVQLQRGMAGQGWRVGKLKRDVTEAMFLQCRPWAKPLPGRPQVLAVRFSAVPVDACSDWAKHAIDVLCRRTPRRLNRLNIIHDDSPKHCDVKKWWEPAAQRQGFVFIEVRI